MGRSFAAKLFALAFASAIFSPASASSPRISSSMRRIGS
jgi:hypothetical protein